ncbi:MAG TPA: AgmX/PglI C-terminal domain-containing protein [Bdellovibrionales bacterium]|nr:AgmX/PglI C-terminal domain-containing protein [Bdellovibrionales bacterium]
MSRKLIIPFSVFLIAALTAIFAFRTSDSAKGLIKVGRIDSIEGDVTMKLPGSVKTEPAHAKQDLYSGQLIFTERASQAVLSLNGGTSVRVEPATRFTAEADRAIEGLIAGTVVEGSVTLITQGEAGTFKLFKDGREVALDTDLGVRIPVVQVPINAGATTASAPEAEKAVVVSEATPNPEVESTPTPAPAPIDFANTKGAQPNAPLTNDEIRSELRGQTPFFQRCYLAYVNRSGLDAQKAGVITVGFTIGTNGKVKAANLIRSDFKDSTLNNCLVESIGRTSFRAFDGDDIPVLEFPIDLG